MTTTTRSRYLGRLLAVGLAGSALLVPASALAVANGNPPSVECAGYAYYLKIDNIGDGGITAGSYTSGTANVVTNWTGQTITVSNVTSGGQAFDWASTKTVAKVVSKEGSSEFITVTGLPGKSGSVANFIQQGLSHVTFCGNAESQPTPTPTVAPTPTPTVAPTPTPTVAPTPTPTVAPTPTPTVAPTPTPTVAPTPTPTTAPTPTPTTAPTPTPEPTGTPELEETPTPDVTSTPNPTPTGTVEAETGKPRVTPPSTDTTVGGGSSSSNGFGLVMLVLGGLALAASLVRPAGKRVRR